MRYSAIVPITQELVEDANNIRPHLLTGVAVAMVAKQPTTRYKRIYQEGYWAALEDIRSGRLVLAGDHFRVGQP